MTHSTIEKTANGNIVRVGWFDIAKVVGVACAVLTLVVLLLGMIGWTPAAFRANEARIVTIEQTQLRTVATLEQVTDIVFANSREIASRESRVARIDDIERRLSRLEGRLAQLEK